MSEATLVRTGRVRSHSKRESGAALLVAVLLLAMLGVIGLASMETVTRDRQVAGFQNRARVALYAADAGVAHAVGIIRAQAQTLAPGGEAALETFDPAFPGKGGATMQALGSDFPAPGSPSYGMDPNALDPINVTAAAQAIRYIGKGSPCPGWIMSSESNAVQWREAIWDIRVVGAAPGGGDVAIQAAGANCHPYGS